MKPIHYFICLMAVVTASCTKTGNTPTATTSSPMLTEIKITNGTTIETRKFQYSTSGKLSTYTSTTISNNIKTLEGTTTYTYNANNMPIKEVAVYITNGTTKTVTGDYTYSNGLLQNVKYTDPDNGVKEWVYQYSEDRVSKVTNTWEQGAVWTDMFIDYNSAGNINQIKEVYSEASTSAKFLATNTVYDGHQNFITTIPGLVNPQSIDLMFVQLFSLHNIKEYDNGKGRVINTIIYDANGFPKRITNNQNSTVYEFTY